MSTEELLFKDVLELMNNEFKEKYGEYNREIVKKYYSVTKMTDDTEKAYNKTLNRT